MNPITSRLFTTLVGATGASDADLIRRTAEEVLQRPEFQHGERGDSSGLTRYLLDLVVRLFDFLGGLWHISPVLACVIVAILIIAIVALVVHMIYTIRQAWVSHRPAVDLPGGRRSQLDPAKWEREAEEAAGRHDYIGAVRLLFRAAVIRLEQGAGRMARPGTTNREYLNRYRYSSVIDALRQFVEVIDAKWYGYGICDADDYQRCRQAHALIRGAAGAAS